MKKAVAVIVKLIIAVVFTALSVTVLSPAFAPLFAGSSGDNAGSAYVVYGVSLLFFLLILFAPTVRRAFGRGFLILGVALFLLPVSSMLLGGAATVEAASGAASSDEATMAAGVGVMMTGGMAIVGGVLGFILGSVSLIIGTILALGGRREVVVVEKLEK